MTTEDLLAELTPNTDMALLVRRVVDSRQPWVVVPGSAISAWERRDPHGWRKVRDWLDAEGVTLVRI
ncbi:MAG TPA: hypothetical protein VJX92_11050 [Methylomirabilota bacterium]|nr:hypothetical protein [Methylomirabilota bacterium]